MRFTDEALWESLKKALSVFCPLADCIGQAEREDGSLGECFRQILNLGRFILSLRDDSSEIFCAAMDSYLLYISEMKLGKEELGLYFAAYLLDRRFHRTCLTETAVDLALRSIIRVVKKSNITPGMIEAALIP